MRHLLKLSMVLLASVAVFFVYSFTAQVAPWYVAVVSAGSLVSVYLGLAYTPIPRSQRRFAISISALAMLIEMLYGILYVLSVQAPYLFEPPLPMWADIALVVLHGAPFTLLLFGVSLFIVHNQHDPQHLSTEERIVITLDQQAQILKQLAAAPDAERMLWAHNTAGHTSQAPSASQPDAMQAPNANQHASDASKPDAMQALNANQHVSDAGQERYICPNCGTTLNRYQYANAKRFGYCSNCK